MTPRIAAAGNALTGRVDGLGVQRDHIWQAVDKIVTGV